MPDKRPKKPDEGSDQKDGPLSERSKRMRSYARYSGLAIQMGIIILAGAYGGKLLDQHLATARPYFTLVGSLLGIGVALYVSLKDLYRPSP